MRRWMAAAALLLLLCGCGAPDPAPEADAEALLPGEPEGAVRIVDDLGRTVTVEGDILYLS